MLSGSHGISPQGWGLVGAAAVGTLAGRGASAYVAQRPLQLLFAGVTLLAAIMMLIKFLG